MEINFNNDELHEISEDISKFIDGGYIFNQSLLEKTKKCSDLLSQISELIDQYDTDKCISFEHTELTNKCNTLNERMSDYKKKLENFKEDLHIDYEVNMLDGVEKTISEIAAVDINRYTTQNIIGIENTVTYQDDYDTTYEYTVTPDVININDVLTTGSYSDILETKYNNMLEIDPEMFNTEDGEVISSEEYIQAFSYMGSFQYDTVKDDYLEKCNEWELFINAVVITVGVAAMFATGGLAGIILLSANAAITAIDVGRALYEIDTGKDLLSGETLDTSDKVMTGIFALLDVAFLPMDISDIGKISTTTTNLAKTTSAVAYDSVSILIDSNVNKFINTASNIPSRIKNSDLVTNASKYVKDRIKKIDDYLDNVLNFNNYAIVDGPGNFGVSFNKVSQDFNFKVYNVDNVSDIDNITDINKVVDAKGIEIEVPTSLEEFKKMYPDFDKPKFASRIEKWYNNKGTAYIDSEGTLHYLIKTKNNNVYDVPYRTDGPGWNPTYPDLSEYYVGDVISYDEILEKTGKELTGIQKTDNEIMKKILPIEKGNTWHHLNDGGMVQVPTEIHSKISHMGGAAGYRNGNLP